MKYWQEYTDFVSSILCETKCLYAMHEQNWMQELWPVKLFCWICINHIKIYNSWNVRFIHIERELAVNFL